MSNNHNVMRRNVFCSLVVLIRGSRSNIFTLQLLFQILNPDRDPNIFKFKNPTLVPATSDVTGVLQCFYIRNDTCKDHADLCYCRNWQITPDPFFSNFWLRLRVRKRNAESCRSRHRCSWSVATSGINVLATRCENLAPAYTPATSGIDAFATRCAVKTLDVSNVTEIQVWYVQ